VCSFDQLIRNKEIVMRKFLVLIAGLAGLTAAIPQASAQSVGVYIGPSGYRDYGPGYGYYGYGYGSSDRYDYRYADRYRTGDGVRVYGYVRRNTDATDKHSAKLRRSGEGCGTYHFWDGDRCVDARDR
jgi:hypothetical protein